MQRSGFVKVQGCAFLAQSSAHITSAMEESWLRIEHIMEICPLVGVDRIREAITKDEYDNRPNDEFYGKIKQTSTTFTYWKFFTSCRLYLAPQHSRVSVLEILESAESLAARINATEFPPETPEPTVLGYAQELNNVQTVSVTVPDIDDFSMITFRGKAARTANAALVMADNVMSTVAPEDIGVGSNPLTATGALVIALPAGNIRVSRNDAGTVLYLVADDAVQAFGIEIVGT